jgi:hypothetical protein
MPKFSAPILDSKITLPSTGLMTPPPQVIPSCARSFSENTTPRACCGVHCPVQKKGVQPQLSRRPLAAIQSAGLPSFIHVIDRPMSARNIPSLKLSIRGLFVGRQWGAYLISFLTFYREINRIPCLLDSVSFSSFARSARILGSRDSCVHRRQSGHVSGRRSPWPRWAMVCQERASFRRRER